MLLKKALLGFGAFIHAVAFPLLFTGFSLIDWRWPLVGLLAMTGLLIIARLNWHPLIFVTAGALLGLFALWTQWQLLILVLTQAGFSLMLVTQKLTPRSQLTLWFLQVFFNQVLLFTQLTHTLTTTMLLDLTLILLPFLIALWADKLPNWSDLTLLIIVLATGYILQRLTIVLAIALLLIPTLVNTRRLQAQPLLYVWGAVLVNVLYSATRLHG